LPFRDIQTHLRDIFEAVGLIEDFVGDMGFDAYRKDIKTKSAVERQMQIVAEAAKRLGEDAGPKYLGPDWLGYCDMGNVLRHAYHRIDDEIIWNTIKSELPDLRARIAPLIDERPK
jgi:uncharacterized protein with HEPN domain